MVAGALSVGVASAATVSINLGSNYASIDSTDAAGLGSLTHWNNASGASGSLQDLTDSTGASTAFSATWAASTTYFDNPTGSDGNTALTKGYLDDGAPGLKVTLSGLTSGDSYKLTLYASSDGTDTLLPFDVNGETATFTDNFASYAGEGESYFVEGKNYVTVTAEADGNGEIVIQGTLKSGYNRGSLAGVQFTTVPEPSSAALLGLGGLALILRRRK